MEIGIDLGLKAIGKILQIKNAKKRREELQKWYDDNTLKHYVINLRSKYGIELINKIAYAATADFGASNVKGSAKAALMDLENEAPNIVKILNVFRENNLIDRTKKLWKYCMDATKGNL